ncbi:MAG: SUMF1/EgtB/PvdO family nonheme iron enzyme [Chitinispirillaceae bacterium]
MYRLILLTICVALGGVSAQEVSLSGIVTDEQGNAVAGAAVRLSSDSDKDYVVETNQAGEFTLDATLAVSPRHMHQTGSGLRASIVNGSARVYVPQAGQRVSVKVFNTLGEKLSSHSQVAERGGWSSIALCSSPLANGLYLVKLQVGTNSCILKTGYNNKVGLYGTNSVRAHNTMSLSKRAAAADVVDTIIVRADGYAYTRYPIEEYEQSGLEIVTQSLNPWQPRGELEYDGGMVKIVAAGHSFEMGQPDQNIWENERSDMEQPVHIVEFTHDFWMDTTEVTQGMYETVMSASYEEYTTPEFAYSVGEQFPAHCVLWGDAALYCNAKSKQDGLDTVYSYSAIQGVPGNNCSLQEVVVDFDANGYRLPTEAEWEYACKGGTFTDYYWGDNYSRDYPATEEQIARVSEYAVWSGNSWDMGAENDLYGPHAAGLATPNAYGLYEMAGNVYEWCNDYWGEYPSGTVTDPTGPESGNHHCLRGGSWGTDASFLRSANRYSKFPDYPYFFVGFRIVRPID